MPRIKLSVFAAEQLRKSVYDKTAFDPTYDTDNKKLYYNLRIDHPKHPSVPSAYMSDYFDTEIRSETKDIFKKYFKDDCREIRAVEGVIIRKLNDEDKFILEYIPVADDPPTYENYIHAEILDIELNKLGISCDITLEKFCNVTTVIYENLRKLNRESDYTYHSDPKKMSFKQFTITPKTETDLAQFLFYFNDCIFNGVHITCQTY
jgi:hypothetical protein